MYNRIVLVGRLTREPELRYTPNGTPVCQFGLAVDSGFGENKRTDFINIVVWGKLGENCNKYLSKGKVVLVEGRLQLRNYENSEGRKIYLTEVVAEVVRFLTPKESEDENIGEDIFPPIDDELPF